ncbi:MAG: hypothetical protein M1822_004306 [Bathelium mastoideum]|nr:MAG: hypothetical protein M1822_004306 [Bathelium mastoideum]
MIDGGSNMLSLLSLPTEVLHTILTEVNHTDLASLSQTCGVLHRFIKHDALLWKQTYLSAFDKPIRDPQSSEPDWKSKIQRIVTLQKILQSPNPDVKRENLDWVVEEISSLLHGAAHCARPSPNPDAGRCVSNQNNSRNVALLTDLFDSDHQVNINNLVCGSSLFEKSGYPTMRPYETEEQRQNAAKLHVLYGVPVDLVGVKEATHPFARSRIYDLRYYTDKTRWGPFSRDGNMDIDWEDLEAVLILIAYNFRIFRKRTNGAVAEMWDEPFAGIAPDAWPIVKEPELPLEDPYGCHGTWMRVVCFLDYTDLYAFNFTDEAARHKDPREHPKDPLNNEEAIRLITCKLTVTSIEKPGPEDGQDLPAVHFRGNSRSRHTGWDPNADSKLRGVVRLMKNGHIRWTTWSIFHGEERWRSEGIQIGGIRSARGIVGNWFDKDFDLQGPVGPTAFWKISDKIVDDDKIPQMPWT